MRRLLLIVAILLVMLVHTHGKTLFERSFEELGYESIEATTKQCKEYSLVMPNLNGYAFLTLFADFIPESTGSASIESYFNGKPLAELYANEFDCAKDYCVAYIPIESSLIKPENTLKICLRPSESIVKVVLSNKSKVGIYAMGVFKKSDFRKCVVSGNKCLEHYSAVLGEDLNVRISIKNSGNEDESVVVEALRAIAGESETKQEIGRITFSAIIKPQEERSFYYTVRVKQLTRFNLPPSALYYTDEFGRKHTIFSNTITIIPKEKPEIGAMLFTRDVNKDSARISVALSNNSGVEIKEAEVVLLGEELIALPEKQVVSIKPRSSSAVDFIVKNIKHGRITCAVNVKDYNMQVKCNTVELAQKEFDISPIVAASVLLIILAIIVFLYLNSQPE
ncbi:MAG: hypothetical protein J7L44_02335 [Candidatus Diapherotrites archaeon]|nr:hypothetical protein [Candidatus Diapherotrites archaeon]